MKKCPYSNRDLKCENFNGMDEDHFQQKVI